MRNYSLIFVYDIYIKEKFPKYVRLSNSSRPQGDSADTQCPQAAQRKQAERACSLIHCNINTTYSDKLAGASIY